MFWKIVYTIYPPLLRFLERLHVHNTRQDFLLGKLNPKYTRLDLEDLLTRNGFSHAILAWKDPGEILGFRLVDQKIFQYHIRLFDDGEIRGHYEYSSEGNPLFHVLDIGLKDKRELFHSLLKDYLVQH